MGWDSWKSNCWVKQSLSMTCLCDRMLTLNEENACLWFTQFIKVLQMTNLNSITICRCFDSGR